MGRIVQYSGQFWISHGKTKISVFSDRVETNEETRFSAFQRKTVRTVDRDMLFVFNVDGVES